jgi:hypothetical protein
VRRVNTGSQRARPVASHWHPIGTATTTPTLYLTLCVTAGGRCSCGPSPCLDVPSVARAKHAGTESMSHAGECQCLCQCLCLCQCQCRCCAETVPWPLKSSSAGGAQQHGKMGSSSNCRPARWRFPGLPVSPSSSTTAASRLAPPPEGLSAQPICSSGRWQACFLASARQSVVIVAWRRRPGNARGPAGPCALLDAAGGRWPGLRFLRHTKKRRCRSSLGSPPMALVWIRARNRPCSASRAEKGAVPGP